MEVNVVENGLFDRDITITVAAEKVDALLSQEMTKTAAQVRLPGFRAGKVPTKMIEQRFGASIRAEVAEQLFRDSYPTALMEKGLRPVGQPELDLVELEKGKPFTYTAKIQIFPVIEPKDYTGMSLTKPVVTIQDSDVETVITRVREANAEYRTQEGVAAASGDRMTFDFEGFVDGEAFEGGKAEDYVLELGSNRFIPGFEDQLIGAKGGDALEVKVTFPEDYHGTQLAGKEAIFKCVVKAIESRELPEVDEELAKKAGVQEGGVEAMKQEIHERLVKEADKVAKQEMKQQVFKLLLENNPNELPSQMVDHEIEQMVATAKEEYSRQGVDPEQLGFTDETWRNQYAEKAKERIILGLLMGSIVSKENLEIDDQAVEAHIDALVQQFAAGDYAEQLKAQLKKDKARLEEFRGAALEEKTVAWLIEQGTVTEEEKSFEELVAQRG
ncbi:trigger factor [Magnetococcus marinus MC-1]|uniref:Trigger factor n=1 Tax=Magnetococcus marinus (strain ATCC BAA-1437 / JCM 17883 / MC-1) TaxID=156889 RepID=TIG_MAGMM|nr:trigger factor [Magnetococcus marinus]A0LDT5.1 RecName: Full=Trigger factor; Short=TF; AltName: Full=PPIase [Magnetococcus marinus MC-1]ABK46128.1 trigger factor [Magnetococcus marinus MC-1]